MYMLRDGSGSSWIRPRCQSTNVWGWAELGNEPESILMPHWLLLQPLVTRAPSLLARRELILEVSQAYAYFSTVVLFLLVSSSDHRLRNYFWFSSSDSLPHFMLWLWIWLSNNPNNGLSRFISSQQLKEPVICHEPLVLPDIYYIYVVPRASGTGNFIHERY